MRHLARTALLLFIGLVSLAVASPAEARNWYAGGGIGLGFGSVDWVDLSGVVGYRLTPRASAGVRLVYRAREDGRFVRDVSTTDYGGSVFARFTVKRPFYVQAEYEYLNFEFIRPDLSTEREDFQSVLVGGGVAQPLSKNVVLFATGLYNLSHDDDDLRSPYDSPWIFRAGIAVRF